MVKVATAILMALIVMDQTPRPPKPGVKTPGVKIPIERLKPDAVFSVPGTPDWLAIDEAAWVSNEPRDSVTRMDPATNKVVATITVGKKPCSGLAAGFGSLWVPNCGDQTMSRAISKPARYGDHPDRRRQFRGGSSPARRRLADDGSKGTLAR
jgi:YVTN family beta-propeller protein